MTKTTFFLEWLTCQYMLLHQVYSLQTSGGIFRPRYFPRNLLTLVLLGGSCQCSISEIVSFLLQFDSTTTSSISNSQVYDREEYERLTGPTWQHTTLPMSLHDSQIMGRFCSRLVLSVYNHAFLIPQYNVPRILMFGYRIFRILISQLLLVFFFLVSNLR